MRALLLAAALSLPAMAGAVGLDDDAPPKPTKTTTECQDGLIWDEGSKACVAPRDSRLGDDTLYGAAREFAHAGRYDHALGALAAMADQDDDRVLTYKGFALRKSGDLAGGLAHYDRALSRNPDNLLARSYLGLAYLEMGQIALARAELREIRARGGRMTWPEMALALALRGGPIESY